MKNASLLVYDIPDAIDYPNPSGRLRRIAIRINLSCWVACNDAIPWTLLDEMQRAGCSWHVVKFDPQEGDKLIKIAADGIRRELLKAVEAARLCEERAALSDWTADSPQAERARKRYRLRVMAAIRRANKRIADARLAMRTFGLEESDFPLDASFDAMRHLQSAYAVRAAVYANMQRVLSQARTDTALLLSRAAAQDRLDPMIAADALDEAGETDAAALVRQSFAEAN